MVNHEDAHGTMTRITLSCASKTKIKNWLGLNAVDECIGEHMLIDEKQEPEQSRS